MDNADEIKKLQDQLIDTFTSSKIYGVFNDFWGKTPQKGNYYTSDVLDSTFGKNPAPAPVNTSTGDKETSVQKSAEKAPEEAADTLKKENIDDLCKELDEYIGLTDVKDEVHDLINIIKVNNMRKAHDLPLSDMSLHMVFMGNPGTGKTMMARFMARVYHSLGILSKGHLVEVDRSGLVAGFVGQTAMKTSDVIKKALGGVLFIDEAYSLSSHNADNDYGREAIETLLKAMEDNRGDLIVIVAGYTELMDEFVNSNPGLRSRFNRYMYFEDYTVDEMYKIFMMRCEKSFYKLENESTGEALKKIIENLSGDENFGNARGVRNLFEDILVEQANRLASCTEITKESLMTITADDIIAAGKEE